MAAPSKYVPRPNGLELELNTLTVQTGRLHIQRCTACGHHQHPPRRRCASCSGDQVGLVPTTNTGEVYSWVTSHFTVDSGWVDDVPYTTVVVQLTEGPRIVGAYNGDPELLRIGQKVGIRPEPRSDDFAFLWVDG